MNKNKSNIFNEVTNLLMDDKKEEAREYIISKYPRKIVRVKKKNYSLNIVLEQFFRDGFIDRYSGERLINPGLFKVLSVYFPMFFHG